MNPNFISAENQLDHNWLKWFLLHRKFSAMLDWNLYFFPKKSNWLNLPELFNLSGLSFNRVRLRFDFKWNLELCLHCFENNFLILEKFWIICCIFSGLPPVAMAAPCDSSCYQTPCSGNHSPYCPSPQLTSPPPPPQGSPPTLLLTYPPPLWFSHQPSMATQHIEGFN